MKKLVLAAATICALGSSVSMAGGLLATHPLARVAVVQQLAVLPALNTSSKLGAMPAFSSAGLGALPGLERTSLAATAAAGKYAWITYDATVWPTLTRKWANYHVAEMQAITLYVVGQATAQNEGPNITNPAAYANLAVSAIGGGVNNIILPAAGGSFPVPRPHFPGDFQLDLPGGLLFGSSNTP